jgi:tetratricopeptide (TPR) repeat protein
MSGSARLPLPPGIPATGAHVEREMILAIDSATNTHQRKEALWQLILFYHEQAKRNDLATALLHLMIAEFDDPENTAVVYYLLGIIAQIEENWQIALELYENGLLQLPQRPHTAYFLRNGAGYCLNKLGRYAEGEKYCRWALEAHADRPDAFKNLGISLDAQGDFKGAIWCWVEALKLDPTYAQAQRLLDEVFLKHPTLKEQFTWIEHELHQKNSGTKLN